MSQTILSKKGVKLWEVGGVKVVTHTYTSYPASDDWGGGGTVLPPRVILNDVIAVTSKSVVTVFSPAITGFF